ncbi:efflux RND transporter periplasmic adaptor subunit [Thauera sinica]|uniref:Efflux RND transporter periplasmic adaptor subunit n=1 Tax=Thauera sinica TaxID=2665146 RepID=A0ABW1AX88_9RHOO|nr:efflux RND transporter periplasmic adaptor subunit [Thauera sp. K11]
MNMRGWIIVVAAGAAFGGCSRPPEEAAPPLAVLVRSMDKAQVAAGVQVYTGEVRARIETDLGFRIGGKILQRRADVGARVRAGEVLALLDPQDARLAAGAAAAAEAAAAADLALAEAEFKRASELRTRNFISDSALDTRRTALQAAQARLRQARAQAATALNQADYTRLLADADGVVTSVLAEPGQVVAAGQPVVRVAQPGEREVLIHVPENRVRGFAPGGAATVRPWMAADRSYAARVREVAPAADSATRTYALRVSVPGADDALPLGATAGVSFEAADQEGVLLPLPAVTRVGDRAQAWVVDAGDKARMVAVEVGGWREDGVLVRGGLPADARVVVAGVHRLVEGAPVRPVEEGAPVALDVER